MVLFFVVAGSLKQDEINLATEIEARINRINGAQIDLINAKHQV